jgi:hypothetical protein
VGEDDDAGAHSIRLKTRGPEDRRRSADPV